MGKRTGRPRGRPKGSKDKLLSTGKVLARRKGITPLEFLLNIMDDIGNELSVRMDAAKHAAPYCHQRLAQLAIDHSGTVQVNKVERTIVHADNSDSRDILTVN